MNKTKSIFFVLVFGTVLIFSLFLQPQYKQFSYQVFNLLSKSSRLGSLKENLPFIYDDSSSKTATSSYTGVSSVSHIYQQLNRSLHLREVLRLPKPLFYTLSDHPGENTTDIRKKTLKYDHDQKKLIVIYTTSYGGRWLPQRWSADGNLFFINNQGFNCPMKCAFTDNKTFVNLADAVVFGVLDSLYHTKPGERMIRSITERRKDQIWIASTIEPALYHDCNALQELNYLFNWTATYRLDSEVYWPYGFFYKLEKPMPLENISLPNATFLRSKKLAASLISNCNAYGGRDAVINSLKKYVAIDSYGGCGDKKCPDNSKCREYLANHYKFFLAFENSLCQDYVTEKFFATFGLGIVPVTYGLGNYAEIAPPHSYINALDFPNTKALAEYLTYLDENDEEYLKYFRWKQNYAMGDNGAGPQFCALCMKVWEPVRPKRITEGFNSWWNHKRDTSVELSNNSTLASKLLQDYTTGCVSFLELVKSNYISE